MLAIYSAQQGAVKRRNTAALQNVADTARHNYTLRVLECAAAAALSRSDYRGRATRKHSELLVGRRCARPTIRQSAAQKV